MGGQRLPAVPGVDVPSNDSIERVPAKGEGRAWTKSLRRRGIARCKDEQPSGGQSVGAQRRGGIGLTARGTKIIGTGQFVTVVGFLEWGGSTSGGLGKEVETFRHGGEVFSEGLTVDTSEEEGTSS